MRMKKTACAAFGLASCLLAFAGDARAGEGLKLSLELSTVPAAPATPAAPPTSATAPAATPAARPTAITLPARTQWPVDSPRQYRIGEEDLIEIKVFGVDQLSRTVRVNPRGQITLPLIGAVSVAGLTAQSAEALIAAKLGETYLQNPQVSLFITEFTSQRVTVEGAVVRPGVYPIKGHNTLLTSLALAGGPARMSATSQVLLFRPDGKGGRVATMYDVDRIRTGELPDPDVFNDDLIVVNRTASRVVLRDSLFGDMLDVLNPFRYAPVP